MTAEEATGGTPIDEPTEVEITGESLVAGTWVRGTGPSFHAVEPTNGLELPDGFYQSGMAQVAEAARAAAGAAAAYRQLPLGQRADFLDATATAIDELGDSLVHRVVAETALPTTRAAGERARTVAQLRMFADLVRAGDFLGQRHDPALPERTPLPRPELRLTRIPLGPVAVFGASNFPLAFSVAGGDTASALAAGCPVLAKAHPAHPGVSELVARAVLSAAESTGMPRGVFSLLHGGPRVGQALVSNPWIKAVGFTGSRRGGLAIVAAAAARPEPIPVYAEMSSVNPVVLLPGALRESEVDALAAAYAASLTREAGQYCTNPGLLFAPSGAAGDRFVAAAVQRLTEQSAQHMTSAGLARSCAEGVARWRAAPGVTALLEGRVAGALVGPSLYSTELSGFTTSPALVDEVFGPVGLVVRYDSIEELASVLAGLEGQLTATMHGADADLEQARRLLPVLESRAGRVVWNGWPTGVEVAPAMVHGGPWPATSAPSSTSVGTLAVQRFLRPVCYQGLPEPLLPVELS